MKTILALLPALLFTPLLGLRAAKEATIAALPFHQGDRVAFVGDSITHGGSYHADIYLFYATRFPSQRFESFNCGVSGDSAEGTFQRMQTDILSHHPSVASIMLGMNDVGRHLYTKSSAGARVEAERKEALAFYAENMRKLASGLRDAGARLIFITPSIFDQTAVLSSANDPYLTGSQTGVNTGLGRISSEVRELAHQLGAPVVDFNAEMGRLNLEQQKADPSFTLIGEDRVHPGPVGHFVMAYLFLKAQGVPRDVSRIVINAATGKAVETANGKLQDLKTAARSLSFRFQAEALPFPVLEACRPALKLVPFMQEMNRELLQVKGLEPGAYEILIDGEPVRPASAAELAAGLNLAESANTPQARQAAKAMEINDQRRDLVADKLRGLAMAESSYLTGEKYDPKDYAAIGAIFDRKLEPEKKRSYYGYVRGICDSYLTNKPLEAETWKQVNALTDKLWTAATPKPHTYEIRPMRENRK